MSPLEEMVQKGTEAVKQLRKEKLANGLSFMINFNDLPSYQCYLEQPDGSIHLVTLAKSKIDFDLVRVLSPQESSEVRQKAGLED